MDSSKKWRDYFEVTNNNSKSFKLFIETAYGCHGTCVGCPIPLNLRMDNSPKWEINNLERTLLPFAENLLNYRKSNKFPEIENLAITLGPAENLYFTENYLENLANISNNFSSKLGVKNYHVAITTSGLFSENKVVEKLELLSNVLPRHNLSFAFIINVRQFLKTPHLYYNFATLLFKYTDLVELEVNLDTQLNCFTSEDIKSFSAFINSFDFIQLDFAYAINEGNSLKTIIDSFVFYEFVENIRGLVFNKNRDYFSTWGANLSVSGEDHFDYNSNFNTFISNTTASGIRLNALGEWHFAKSVFGNLYFDSSYGFPPLAIGADDPYSDKSISEFKKRANMFFNKLLSTHIPCLDCGYKNTCVQSGYLTYAAFCKKTENKCSNPAYKIFSSLV